MEKVTVNAVMPKVSQKGANYQAVVYNGGVQAIAGATNGDFIPYIGKEVEVELEVSKDGKTTFIKLPGTANNQTKKPFTPYPKADPIFKIRYKAAVLALDNMRLTNKYTREDLLVQLKFWDKYLKDGEVV